MAKKRLLNVTVILSMLLGMASCESKEDVPAGPIASEGEDVAFSLDVPERSRTMYDNDWNNTDGNGQVLYWGNYLDIAAQNISKTADNVRIFCGAAAVKAAEYQITAQTAGSSEAAKIEKTAAAGVQWGSKSETHKFYAFYPASKASENLVSGDNTIEAEVSNGQSPITYRAMIGGTSELTDNVLQTLENQTTYEGQGTDKQIITYGQPDMSAALMVAATEVAPADFGKPVPLSFNVIADVLDITVNGPITPNKLNGSDDTNGRAYIKIHSITITNNEGTAICGKFTLNMDTKKAIDITNGVDRIQLQTAQTSTDGGTHYPTLYVRSTSEAADVFDQLRVRAFLIPGQVSKLSQLTITVSTDCGEYTQVLNDESTTGTIVSGQIHPIKLKYFNQRGKEFQFEQWIAQLDPDIYVNELSLPGTWMSYSAQAGSVKYQDLTIEQQLQAGIRAFQFHVAIAATDRTSTGFLQYNYTYSDAYINNTYSGNYGSAGGTGPLNYTSVTLASVLDEIGKFIADNPKEFAIVNIGMEGNRGYTSALPTSTTLAQNWLPKVAEAVNGCQYVYKTEITPNTTIADVQGKVIIKINTNSTNNENSTCDALFSRWDNGDLPAVSTIALNWGSPIAPDATTSTLKWCFVENAQVGQTGYATLAQVRQGIANMATESYENYSTGNHDTWYYCCIGGYQTSASTANAQSLASNLNPYTLQILSDPTRQACPMGQILMNYCGTADYSSPDLIRTIINNNAAFVLNKASASSPKANVTDKTNSNFNPTQGNAYE